MQRMEEDDATLVERARGGEAEAYRALVEHHSRAVFRLAYRMTGNEQDAEDVVQEAFLKAYRNLGRFEERAHFGTWLHRIAANCAYDLLRSRARREETPLEGEEAEVPALPDGAPSPDRLVLASELQRRLRAAMARLSPLERSAFLLRHQQGMSIQEIGAALGLEKSATKHSIFRAVRKMREALQPLQGVS
jgi:RNA polymerase sigma-70 factor (ECF subfamily)